LSPTIGAPQREESPLLAGQSWRTLATQTSGHTA
jgi:hypothetical protein